jgi:DNA (cytosine-5)-methyltransferase 1
LFCGSGGLSLGLQEAGFDVLLAADNWQVATRTYALNFTHPVLTVDLATATAIDLRKAAGRARFSQALTEAKVSPHFSKAE